MEKKELEHLCRPLSKRVKEADMIFLKKNIGRPCFVYNPVPFIVYYSLPEEKELVFKKKICTISYVASFDEIHANYIKQTVEAVR